MKTQSAHPTHLPSLFEPADDPELIGRTIEIVEHGYVYRGPLASIVAGNGRFELTLQ